MKVQLYNIDPGKLCWVTVTPREALALIQSLARQIQYNDCNTGRLESRCRGDATELSILVKEEQV
jgi:hypothetical protein